VSVLKEIPVTESGLPTAPAFRKLLADWYRENARSYPWRERRTPYRIAISELMLRRTRADQVVPVFEEFVRRYPSIRAAADAEPCRIRELLRPLGLQWRAETAVAFVQEAHARYGDDLPANAEAIRQLPGAGEYVSGAVATFAGNEVRPLIDANVVRVLGRVFGVSIKGDARRHKAMRQLADAALDREDPITYHYALLDFAALVCRPRRPRCSECPMAGQICQHGARRDSPA